MIDAQDVVRVQMVGGDSLLEQLLLGAIGPAVIAAVVGWVVTRGGRNRKDLEDWRETRNAKYSEILVAIDEIKSHFTSAEREVAMAGPNVPIDQERQSQVQELDQRLKAFQGEVRLMGWPDVFHSLVLCHFMVSTFAIWLHSGERTSPDSPPQWTLQGLDNIRRQFLRVATALEEDMQNQLGVRYPRPVRDALTAGWDATVVELLRWTGVVKRK